jgi:hypothetical protein
VTAVLDAVKARIADLSAAVDAASPLDSASLATLAPAIQAAQKAASAVDAAIAATDGLILSSAATGVAGVVAGGFAPDLAAGLLAQIAAMQNIGVLMTQKGAVGGVNFALQNATG